MRDLDVVRRAARAFAQRFEIEPDDALAAAAHRNLARFDLDVARLGRLPTAELGPAAGQPGIAAGIDRGLVHRRAGQRAHAVIFGAFGVQFHAVGLQQPDRGQEAVALQAVEVQVLHCGVGGGHQGHALGEHALEQARQQHRIADIGDEELVQHQHAQFAAPFLGDLRQRIALPLVLAQALVDAAHEAMEVGAVLLLDRQAVIEQVDQEGLAAPHPAPEVQALDRFGLLPECGKAIQPAILRAVDQRDMDAVQLGQGGVLGRVVLPFAPGHAIGVALRRGHHGVAHAASGAASGAGTGSHCLTPWMSAPRRSTILRWKKWLVSGMRTSSCGASRPSSQS